MRWSGIQWTEQVLQIFVCSKLCNASGYPEKEGICFGSKDPVQGKSEMVSDAADGQLWTYNP